MHGTDILNTALIKHFLATGVKGLEGRVGTSPVTVVPHNPISNSCKRWAKINADEDLLVSAETSVDYIRPLSLSAARSDLQKRQVMWRIAADVDPLAPELVAYEARGRCAVCIQAIAGT